MPDSQQTIPAWARDFTPTVVGGDAPPGALQPPRQSAQPPLAPADAAAITRLSPQEEQQFQQWAIDNQLPDVDHPDSHYDYRGFWKATGGAPHPPGAQLHFPDTFKQPGHPTFSQESQYSTGPSQGGMWVGPQQDTYLAQPRLAGSHASAVQAPQQSGNQPPLAPADPQAAWQKAATIGSPSHVTIGASRVGERYAAPSWAEIGAMRNPLIGLIQRVQGPGKPQSVELADPTGMQAYQQGAGPLPQFGLPGTTEVVEDLAGDVSRGLFSRIDQVADNLPKGGVHPNKLAGMVKNNPEEAAYRQIPEFLAAQGNQKVTPEAFRAHLAAHPAPTPQVRTLSETATPQSAESRPKWGEHTLPGGGNYQNHVFTLPPRPQLDYAQLAHDFQASMAQKYDGDPSLLFYEAATPEARYAEWQRLRARMTPEENAREADLLRPVQAGMGKNPTPPSYTSHAFPDKNILVWTRSNERTLPNATGQPLALPPGYQLHEYEDLSRGPQHFFEIPGGLGSPHDYPTAEAATRGAMEHAGIAAGERGRFLEEVQSDWHQKGHDEGYQPPEGVEWRRLPQISTQMSENEQQFQNLYRQQTAAANAYSERLQAETRARLPQDYAHLTAFDDATRSGPGALASWRAARETALQTVPELKQLRQAEVDFEPQLQALEERRDELRAQYNLLAHRRGVPDAPFKQQWPDLALKQHLLEVAADPELSWIGHTGAQTQIERWPDEENEAGMRQFYDGKLPSRLQSLLNPFGGKVEPVELPTGETRQRAVGSTPAWAALDSSGWEHGRWESPQAAADYLERRLNGRGTIRQTETPRYEHVPVTASSWVARLSPAMKAEILRRGFPLLALPAAASAASLSSRPGANVGTPPPVQAPKGSS